MNSDYYFKTFLFSVYVQHVDIKGYNCKICNYVFETFLFSIYVQQVVTKCLKCLMNSFILLFLNFFAFDLSATG